jgi:peroxiredoxin
MKRIIILGICIILVVSIVTGCPGKKKQPAALEESNPGEPVEMNEADKEFYDEVKLILKKAGIYPYDSPLEAHYYDFTLENLDGDDISLSDFEGQTIVLNFWATWCGPCIQEMPSMEKLYRDLHDEGFVVIAVDVRDTKESVKKIISSSEITFPVLLDTTGKIGKIYEASSIPLSYLIDTKGYVVGVVLGAIHWNSDKIKEAIRFIINRGN